MPDFAAWNAIQDAASARVWALRDQGVRSLVLTGPTGCGKTRISELILEEANRQHLRSVFYTHRKALFDQTHAALNRAGIDHGCRASGHRDKLALLRDVQLAMLPTELSAVKTKQKRELHNADIVIVDEAHANKLGWAAEVIQYHKDQGVMVLGLTATPVNLGQLYSRLEVITTNSEMRRVGALVPAEHYSCPEVDLKDVKRMSSGEFSQKQLGAKFATQQVVGHVIEHYRRLNPHTEPELLFAPGVKESIWFVDELWRAGITAAHIDGNDVYLGEQVDGQPHVHDSSQEMRQHVRDECEAGRIQIVTNRFVMREGVDWPFIRHLCFATAFGTEEGWVQAGGRGLRQCDGKDKVVIADHGGNWWRWGSLNIDRQWELTDTHQTRLAKRRKQIESGEEHQPSACPRCGFLMQWKESHTCLKCGFQFKRGMRVVLQTDGKLKKMAGTPLKRKSQTSEAQKAWNNLFFQFKNTKTSKLHSFRQLRAIFENESGYRVNFLRDGSPVAVQNGTTEPLKYCPIGKTNDLWDRYVSKTDLRELFVRPAVEPDGGDDF